MELTANGLHIRLDALGPANAEDWSRVTVEVSEAGFGAAYVTWLQSEDVEHFANGLSALHLNVGVPGKAVLNSCEPGISIELESDKQGHITGRYEFKNESAGGFYPVLNGIIDMDQSYLPDWEQSCRELLVALRI